MFIVCGVLYAIDSVTERNTKIVIAVDLYRGYVLSDVNLPFTNPFKNTTMALYNPETKVKKLRTKKYVRNILPFHFVVCLFLRVYEYAVEFKTVADIRNSLFKYRIS